MTWSSNIVAAFTALALLAAGHAAADDLDAATRTAIKSACHGNLLDDDDFKFLDEYLDVRSTLCEEVREAGDDFDYSGAFERHRVPLTQEDLRRIYEPGYRSERTAGKFELECTYNVPGGPVGVDSKCQSIRETLAESGIDVSLSEYQAAEKRCDGHHGCIDKWAENRLRHARQFDEPAGRGPTIDDLLGGPEPSSDDLFDTLDDNAAASAGSTVEPGLGFDDIHAARETLRIDAIRQALFDQGEQIASQCQCVFRGQSCFAETSYLYSQLNDALSEADTRYESQIGKLCSNWRDTLRGRTSDREDVLNRYLKSSESFISNIGRLRDARAETLASLAAQEGEVTASMERAREQERQAQSGFQWGKFAALATGTVIGASMGDLAGADTIEILGNVAMDSMAGVEGANNTMQGMDSITQRHLAELETERSIRQQQQAVDASQQAQQQQPVSGAQTNQSTYSYDDLLASNDVQQQPMSTIKSTSGGGGPWGAIAFSRDKSQSNYGFVVSKSSRQEALQAALSDCGSNCSYQTSGGGSSDTAFKDFCAAVYLGTLSGGTEYRHFFGYNKSSTSAAESDAAGSCSYNEKVHNPGMTCQFVTSGCSGT